MGKQVIAKPKHICIIPDGNRRWAKAHGLKPWEGHRVATSSERVVSLLEEAIRLGVPYLTFWAFSTENWQRDKKEIQMLFDLFREGFRLFKKEFVKNQARFLHIGRKDRIPTDIVEQMRELEELTKNFKRINVQICLDYGGRDELLRAVNVLLKKGKKEIKEEDLVSALDTSSIPDPDLIIRTSGERRLSGFMSFQSAYAELYFPLVSFPEFGPSELRLAVKEFGRRKRNFGK